MAESRLIQKQLAGKEDLLLGVGTVSQARATGVKTITKLNATHFGGVLVVDTINDLNTLDKNQLDEQVVLVKEDGHTYIYNGTSWVYKTTIVAVDTIADLRSISYPVAIVWASGYHTKNDGAFGSHIFRLKGVKTTETDNGGTIIIATIGGTDYVYELQYDGAVNVKWFGAKGDGTSTFSGTDDTIAINRALSLGLDVYTDCESHLITNRLILGSQKIFSIGSNGNVRNTVLYCKMDAGCFTYDSNNYIGYLEIDGFEIVFDTTYITKTSQAGIEILSPLFAHNFNIKNIVVRNATYGIKDVSGSYQSEYSNIFITNCVYGIVKEGGTTINFNRCFIAECTARAWYLKNIVSSVLTNCANDKMNVGGNPNEFINISSLVINGWDGESNNIAQYAAYMYFENCVGVINGTVLIGTELNATEVGTNVSVLYARNSKLSISGYRTIDFNLNELAPIFTGTNGTVANIITNNSDIMITASSIITPTGGTPSERVGIKTYNNGYATYSNCGSVSISDVAHIGKVIDTTAKQNIIDQSSLRAFNTTYTNSIGKEIIVYISAQHLTTIELDLYINNIKTQYIVARNDTGYTVIQGINFTVPVNGTYRVESSSGTLLFWVEQY